MRRMSFAATTAQMYAQTKTVTRRNPATWKNLGPGDRLLAIEKGMGLPKGETQTVIGVIEIVSNRVEPLGACTPVDAAREGFNSLSEFLAVWSDLNGEIDLDAMVRRIEFRHVSEPSADRW